MDITFRPSTIMDAVEVRLDGKRRYVIAPIKRLYKSGIIGRDDLIIADLVGWDYAIYDVARLEVVNMGSARDCHVWALDRAMEEAV